MPAIPLDQLPVAALLLRGATVVAVNAPAAELLARAGAGDDVVGRSLDELVPRPAAAAVREAVARALDKGDAGVDIEGDTGDAWAIGLRLQRVTVDAVATDDSRDRVGEAPDLVVVARDRSAERRLTAVVQASADSTFVLDDEAIVDWQLYRPGSDLEVADVDLVGANPLERIHPEDLHTVIDAVVEGLARPGQRIRTVVRSRAGGLADDSWHRIEIDGMADPSIPGLGGFVVQVRNLERSDVVGSLAETGGQFLSLTEAAPIGIMVGDMLGRTVYANAKANELLGRTGEYEPGWWHRAAPADRQALDDAVQVAMHGGEETTLTAAFGPGHAGGDRVRWLRVHVSPRYAEGRQAVGVITTLEDVTPEVEARRETERLTEMLDATSDYVAVFRPGGEILYANEATAGLLAAVRHDGREGALRDLIDEEPRRAWIAAALEVLQDRSVWQGELALNAGGGRTIPVSALGVVHRTDDGELDWIAMLARDITDLKEAQDRLRHLASHDHLTGLPNRSLFTDRLEQAVARHERERRGVAVLFCDLDGFKGVNDDLGHAAGDQVLVTVADRLRHILRPTDTAARVGGDEFVIVVEHTADESEVAAVAERIIEAVCRPIGLTDGRQVTIGISVGIAVAGPDRVAVAPDRLLTVADTAMYRAKARGGNTYRVDTLD